jgi:hypothetical protein
MGRQISNSVAPGSDFTFTSPLCCIMFRLTTSSPRPEPLPISFIVKRGKDILFDVSRNAHHPKSFFLQTLHQVMWFFQDCVCRRGMYLQNLLPARKKRI